MPNEENVDELRAAADASQKKLDEMVGGGGPASDEEGFIFDAEMIHTFAEQLVSLSDLLEQLTRRVEQLEARSGGAERSHLWRTSSGGH
jgi:ubiquinone biosynthesis protein UbiJ